MPAGKEVGPVPALPAYSIPLVEKTVGRSEHERELLNQEAIGAAALRDDQTVLLPGRPCDATPNTGLVRSKQRIADHGEVFTPASVVGAMLDLVRDETERIDSRFLEPACGSGNFLVQVLQRKLTAVERKFHKSEFERRHYALFGLMCIYGIDLLADNIAECRENLLDILAAYLQLNASDEFLRAASYVLSQNILQGDALTMLTDSGNPIIFAEWGYLGRGKFQRRDFRFDNLTQSSAFGQEGTLFANLGKHDIFTPTKTYVPTTVTELAK